MSRAWGFWTRGKLHVLRDYLDAFTTATKHKANERIYLDLFAGETENLDAITNEEIESSAQIALSIDEPPFTRLRFFELEGKAQELERSLVSTYPGRDIKVYAGDSNKKVSCALRDLRHLSWAPTLAFIDPNSLEAKWCTLEKLARFRRGNYKTELFLLFSPQMFARLLPVRGKRLRSEDETAIDDVFGIDAWREVYNSRLNEALSGHEAYEEYLNLMRWRLETELGYRWTHPLEVKNTRGSSLYFMIFATSNEVGHKIMSHLYNTAAAQFPAMQAEARDRRQRMQEEQSGVTRLFEMEVDPPMSDSQVEQIYVHEPPTQPWFLGEEP